MPDPDQAQDSSSSLPAETTTRTSSQNRLVVGIGASAGGLEAFKAFLAHVRNDTGLTFVLVQHLDPTHDSMLSELLQASTDMPVTEARDGDLLRPNRVFVIPPNTTLSVKQSRLNVSMPAPERLKRRPVDTFFSSLADDQGEYAVAVVLSGTGSDGAAGVQRIKEKGGATLAEAGSDNQAKPGMPQSAVATGCVDAILPVGDMPAWLLDRALLSDPIATSHEDPEIADDETGAHLNAICDLLRERIGRDFREYKTKTLYRRIRRRMQILQIDTLSAYIERLRDDRQEMELLFQELLIGVTEFFRDPAAWDALQETVIPQLLEDKGADETFRVWVAGCATGEEVYSVAITLREVLDGREVQPSVLIFGTDIDSNAVDKARNGLYAENTPGLSAERRSRWFVEDSGGYRPLKRLREMCVFSTHDLTRDPPFSRLDLIVCRNVLIYMKPALQDRILRKFHYALRPQGALFLGSSEGPTRSSRLFGAAVKKHGIYYRRDTPPPAPREFAAPDARGSGYPPATDAAAAALSGDQIDHAARRTIAKYAPAYIVIDRQYEILRFSGGEIGRYLEPSSGAASFNLFSILKNTLRPAVRAALREVFASSGSEAVVQDRLTVHIDGRPQAITLIVEPLAGESDLFLIAFQHAQAEHEPDRPANEPAPGQAELEQELQVTKAQLNEALNELEATHEEMSSANEEYQSVNEELQSSNEELETSKEEMQSINEEMETINAELNSKNEQLTRLNSDLRNLLESTQIATIFLDNQLRIKNFTPAVKSLFHLRESDHGRPLTDIVDRLDYDHIERDIDTVLTNLSVLEREVHLRDEDATFLLRIRPYRTVDNVVDGVVLTFVDITNRLDAYRAELAAIVTSSQDAIIGHSLDGEITSWNAAAERIFGYTRTEAVGSQLADVFSSSLAHELVRRAQRLTRGEASAHLNPAVVRHDGQSFHVALTLSPVKDYRGEPVAASIIARDISERVAAEAQREFLLNELSHRVKNTLATVQAIASQTLETTSTPEDFREAFTSRLAALARTHELLMRGQWHGADLRQIVQDELASYSDEQEPRYTIEGDELLLDAQTALALALGLHELATNAAKHGAFSEPLGWVEVKWEVSRDEQEQDEEQEQLSQQTLHLTWREHDGPRVEKPQRRSFGIRLIEEGLPFELDADVSLDFNPDGVRCQIAVPLKDPAQQAMPNIQ